MKNIFFADECSLIAIDRDQTNVVMTENVPLYTYLKKNTVKHYIYIIITAVKNGHHIIKYPKEYHKVTSCQYKHDNIEKVVMSSQQLNVIFIVFSLM